MKFWFNSNWFYSNLDEDENLDKTQVELNSNLDQDGVMTSWYWFGLNSSTGLTQTQSGPGLLQEDYIQYAPLFPSRKPIDPTFRLTPKQVEMILFSLFNSAKSFLQFPRHVGAEPGTNWFKVICLLCWWRSVGNVLRRLEVDCRDMKYGVFVSTGINLTS